MLDPAVIGEAAAGSASLVPAPVARYPAGYYAGVVTSWDVARDLPPMDVRLLLPAERAELLALLRGLDAADWARETACPGWSVHDIALHLLGDDIGRLGAWPSPDARAGLLAFDVLARSIEEANEDWVWATRRIPPALVVDFLAVTGPLVDARFAALDMEAEGVAVAWTGIGPSPWWLDIAREYTERWVHHQQIRMAVERPVMADRAWLHPVLDAFMRALPRAYEATPGPAGTTVRVWIEGPAGDRWLLRRDDARWRLVPDDGAPATSEVRLAADLAWRLLTRLVAAGEAAGSVVISGDRDLGGAVVRAVAVMTTRT